MEIILQILQWAIPAGGIGTAIGWFWNRRVNSARASKEVHDIYKEMYHDVSLELKHLREENEDYGRKIDKLSREGDGLRRAVNRLSRAIEAIPLCSYHSQCPVLSELRVCEDGGTGGSEAADGIGHPDGRKPGGDKPEERTGRGKAGTVAADVSGQRPPGKGRVQPPGGKHTRVRQEGEG